MRTTDDIARELARHDLYISSFLAFKDGVVGSSISIVVRGGVVCKNAVGDDEFAGVVVDKSLGMVPYARNRAFKTGELGTIELEGAVCSGREAVDDGGGTVVELHIVDDSLMRCAVGIGGGGDADEVVPRTVTHKIGSAEIERGNRSVINGEYIFHVKLVAVLALFKEEVAAVEIDVAAEDAVVGSEGDLGTVFDGHVALEAIHTAVVHGHGTFFDDEMAVGAFRAAVVDADDVAIDLDGAVGSLGVQLESTAGETDGVGVGSIVFTEGIGISDSDAVGDKRDFARLHVDGVLFGIRAGVAGKTSDFDGTGVYFGGSL